MTRPPERFAVHLPVRDAVFGTLHLPGDEWPEAYRHRARAGARGRGRRSR